MDLYRVYGDAVHMKLYLEILEKVATKLESHYDDGSGCFEIR